MLNSRGWVQVLLASLILTTFLFSFKWVSIEIILGWVLVLGGVLDLIVLWIEYNGTIEKEEKRSALFPVLFASLIPTAPVFSIKEVMVDLSLGWVLGLGVVMNLLVMLWIKPNKEKTYWLKFASLILAVLAFSFKGVWIKCNLGELLILGGVLNLLVLCIEYRESIETLSPVVSKRMFASWVNPSLLTTLDLFDSSKGYGLNINLGGALVLMGVWDMLDTMDNLFTRPLVRTSEKESLPEIVHDDEKEKMFYDCLEDNGKNALGSSKSKMEIETYDTATVSSEQTDFGGDGELRHDLDWNAPAKLTLDRDGYVNDCISYCSLFPADYEFTRDIVVWSWIAAGVINPEKNDEAEEKAIWCFDRLVELKYIVLSGYDGLSDQMRYKLGTDENGFFHKRNLEPHYTKGLDIHTNLEDLVHFVLMCEGIDQGKFEILRKCKNLKTLLLHKCYLSKIEGLLNDLFLKLELLEILDLSCTDIVELPSSIENLKALLYLDMTNTSIRRLPESIDSLCKLETLVLLGCTSLCGLPRGMSKLINLQNLVLDFALYLQSMPMGMGKLTNLRTLKAFPVGRKKGYNIEELRNMNKLTGSLCILKLENVSNKEEAGKALLCNKLYLKTLELMWSGLQEKKIDIEEEILENLRPHLGLEELKIEFYGGGVLPSWIADPSFTKITSITLSWCKYCKNLPSFGELPSLRFLAIVEMHGVVEIGSFFCRKRANQKNHAFPQLRELSFEGMSKLELWTGVENCDFPCLEQLVVIDCPNLVSLPSFENINSIQHLDISYCPKISS